jgi:hypothetical protein
MQRYTIFFIAVNALQVSGGFSAHHQELKLYTQRLVNVKLACCYRFIAVNAVQVSGGFSSHHQELKLYTQRLVYVKLACCYR